MAAAKKQKNKTNNPVKNTSGHRQLTALVLFAFAVFLLALTIVEGQKVWQVLHKFMFGSFGVIAIFWPLLIGYAAVIKAMENPSVRLKNKIWQFFILLFLIGTAIDIFSPFENKVAYIDRVGDAFAKGVKPSGGGIVGAFLGQALYSWLGGVGAGIVIILLIFVFAMVITGTTLLGLFRTVARPAKHIRRTAVESYDNYSDRPQNNLIAKNKNFNGNVPYPKYTEAEEDILTRELSHEERTKLIEDKKRRLLESYSGVEQPQNASETLNAPKQKPKRSRKISLSAEPESEEPVPFMDEELLEKFKPKPNNITDKKPQDEETDELINDNAPSDRISPSESPFRIEHDVEEYRFPPMSLLKRQPPENNVDISSELKTNAARLVDTLRSFGVETRIVDISRGPAVTRYELQPSAGVKISKITNLSDDIALNLATAGVRIEAPIPNKAAVGIEVPNKIVSIVNVRELVEHSNFQSAKSPLTVALGRDIAGEPTIADIGKMPHVLVAGSTGSGKSVCINSILISLLYKSSPEDVKLLMIDPKVVELGIYNGIPHLLVPVVTDPRKASGALGWAVTEMLSRYKAFADNNARDLNVYNELAARDDNELKKLPRIVIIIDELADLMMAAPNEVEDNICRLAQMARAAGMHLVIATQRPSVDVITGLIKANIPSRIAFSVASSIDSRTILDMGGAEKLLGRGDMLFAPVGAQKPTRVQGCFVSDKEVEAVVDFVKGKHTQAEYDEEIMEEIEKLAATEKGSKKSAGGNDRDEDTDVLYTDAVQVVLDAGMASTSLLQRRLKLGYARAARIVDMMEDRGIVGPFEGAKPRQVLMTKSLWMEMQARANDTDYID